MPDSHPKDRFDLIPDDLERVGAHRAPRERGRTWVWVAWSAAAVVVLVGIGVIGLFALNGTLAFKDPFAGSSATPTATPTPTPTVVPTVNPALQVIVLNGTNEDGLATELSKKLEAAGWANVTTANATQTDITQTTIYYSDPANEGAARAMAASIPGANVAETQDFAATGAALTVVIGSDYKP
jgi:type IV pilus biogenesis protein CpaD/CtpE